MLNADGLMIVAVDVVSCIFHGKNQSKETGIVAHVPKDLYSSQSGAKRIAGIANEIVELEYRNFYHRVR